MQPGAEDGLEVEVGDDEVFLEREPARDALAALVHDEARAVEYQLVLTAHHVDVGDAHLIVQGARRDHLLAEAGLAGVVGRAVDVDDQFRAGQRLTAVGPAGYQMSSHTFTANVVSPATNTGVSVPA